LCFRALDRAEKDAMGATQRHSAEVFEATRRAEEATKRALDVRERFEDRISRLVRLLFIRF
jgi:hypothetical protein